MNKRQLGKTNINLTAIGFGGAPLGNLFESLDERSCYNILEKTYEAGINIYDTSPLYGYGLSEHRLGNFLKTVENFIKSPNAIKTNGKPLFYMKIYENM